MSTEMALVAQPQLDSTRYIRVGKEKFSAVDERDYSWLSQLKWETRRHTYSLTRYAFTRMDGRTYAMHRLILNAKPGQQIDHIDCNGLNNRRSNLRICTGFENMRNRGIQRNNTSGYKGVCFNRRNGKWMAYIKVNRKQRTLGYFTSPQLAHDAYKIAAVDLHGEFARLK